MMTDDFFSAWCSSWSSFFVILCLLLFYGKQLGLSLALKPSDWIRKINIQ